MNGTLSINYIESFLITSEFQPLRKYNSTKLSRAINYLSMDNIEMDLPHWQNSDRQTIKITACNALNNRDYSKICNTYVSNTFDELGLFHTFS